MIEALEPFVGEWTVEASIAPGMTGRNVFEWVLDGAFLQQRSQIPDPAPDSLAIISLDGEGEAYTQHYFDSRGVVRVYAMTFEDGVWELVRDKPDFSPFEFSQRFKGTFSDDGNRIEGAWEIAEDHTNWEKDFDLTYTREK